MTDANIEAIYPLSPTQEGMLFHTLYDQESRVYFEQVTTSFRGPVDAPCFKRAWQRVVDRHAILRTLFVWEGQKKPLQVVRRRVALAWREEDWRRCSAAEQGEALDSFLRADRDCGFEITKTPPMRLSLIRIADEEYHLVWSFHHVLLDGWSMAIVNHEVLSCYEAFVRGTEPELPPVPPYRDYIQWLQKQSPAKAESFWRQQLAGFTTPTRLKDEGLAAPGAGFREECLEMPEEMSARLRALARQYRLTLSTVFQAVWALLLSRHAGAEDVLFGAAFSGRPPDLPGIESMVGLFIGTLPVRVQVRGEEPFLRWLKRLQDVQFELQQYQHVPLVELQAWSGVPRGMPLFESLVVFENYPMDQASGHSPLGIAVTGARFWAHTNYPLHLRVSAGAPFRLSLTYDASRYDVPTIGNLLRQVPTVLEQLLGRPESPLGGLSLVTPESRAVLPDASATLAEEEFAPVTALFEGWARRSPREPALTQGGRSLSYEELSERARAVAEALMSRGLEPGEVVALDGRPSFGLIAGLLGILFAGAVAWIADRKLPAERRRLMCREAGAKHLLRLTAGEVAEEWWADQDFQDVLTVDLASGQVAEPAAVPGSLALPELDGRSNAYVFFTSGTTGVPKGVLGTHRGLSHFVAWQRATFEVGPGDRSSQLTGLSFDVVLREVFLPLTSGATLCLPEETEELGAERVLPWLEREGITVLHTVPTLAQTWLLDPPRAVSLKSLRIVFFAGEPLGGRLVQRWRETFEASATIVNLYGPTETTLAKCFYVVPADPGEAVQPVGRPLPQSQALVLADGGRPCGIGEWGEIAIRTPYRTRGYVNVPDENRRRFRPNPARSDDRDLIYLTGDRGRFRADGLLEISGRLDDQVKVRGARVEPREIASILDQHPTVRQCAVVARENEGENQLVAYVVPEKSAPLAADDLKGFLKARLPDYMVPSVFVFLEVLPLTANGKLDRRALPVPDGQADAELALETPRSPIEEALAGIWRDVLGVERVGIHADFFALGGHSLLATRVMSQVRKTYEVELPLRALFEAPTIAGLAQKVEVARGSRESGSGPSIHPVPRKEGLPLSFAQQRLWFLDQMGAGVAYNIPRALRLEGALDVGALQRSLNAIVRRHEALRTTFPAVEGRAVQVVTPSLEVALAEVDLDRLSEAERESEARRLAGEEAQRPFDLSGGPLLRAKLLRLGASDHVLLVTIHHIVADGWSMGVLTRELATHYRAGLEGNAASLPELPVQYADFAHWQRQWLRGKELERQLGYWRERLGADLPRLELPTDRPRPVVQTYRGASRYVVFPATLAERLAGLCREEGATLFMVLLAGFKALLYRCTGQSDLAVGSPIANRNRAETEDLIGFFVNSLVMRTDLSGDPSFRELVRRVKETALGAYDHQDLPFEKLVEELQPERDLSQNPLFQVIFAVQNAPSGPLELPGLALSHFGRDQVSTRFDLEIYVWEQKGALAAVFCYNTDLFDASTVDRMGRHWLTLLEAAVSRPESRLSALPLLGLEERREVLSLARGARAAYPRDSTVHAQFEVQAARTPEAVAVVYERERLSYGELNRRANQLAHHLCGGGVGPGVRVGICLERSLDLVVGLLGILKAGGAYVPLDPEYPRERLGFMLEDARPAVLLTEERLLGSFPSTEVRVLCLDRDAGLLRGESSEDPRSGATAEDLAYVTYTSGSTGQPKAVEVRHRGVLRLVLGADYAVLSSEQTLLQLAPVSFDASTLEIWGALLVGGRCVLYPERVPATRELGEVLAREGVSTLWLTASLFNAVVDESPEVLTPVRQLLIGGEALSVPHVRKAQERLPGTRIINGYGPTESTTFTCCHPIPSPLAEGVTSVPIGRPIANTDVYVLDEDLEPVPVGVPGELFIGGDGLARGYLNRPELTADTFVPNSFSEEPGERLYRTGDRVRWRGDGTIEFLGRTDDQVKIRGFRIELGEIQAVLTRHPGVREAAVLVREGTAPSDKRLVAYVVPAAAGKAGAQDETGEREHRLTQWQKVYESVIYDQVETAAPAEPTFNLSGWNSTYTGRPIPAEEMREQVEQAVERTLGGRPKRVLEIGCGTGLLLFRTVPHCERYVGTDFSAVALEYVRKQLESFSARRAQVELWERRADDFEGIEAGSFDVVVLNSVVQYFPDVEYLLRVLEGAVRAVAPGGRVFVGDVRHLPLLEAFATSVELFRTPPGLGKAGLRERVRERLAAEQELVIDPGLFVALGRRWPRVSGVEVRPKRGRGRNELTKYRYDAVLHVESAAPAKEEVQWLDWSGDGLSLERVRDLLNEGEKRAVGIRRVPNPRVGADVEGLRWLRREDEAPLTGSSPEGADPEDVWALGRDLPWTVELSWAGGDAEGRYDVLLRRREEAGEAGVVFPLAESPLKGWEEYTNTPLVGTRVRGLVPQLRGHLEEKLPDYMVPSAFVVLDRLPLSPNGKVDRRALPAPATERPELEGVYVAPRDPIEEAIVGIWRDVLGLKQVGVHDNFFELGGHSLLATQVVSRLRETFRTELPLRSLFEGPTVAGLASAIETARRGAARKAAPPIQRAPREGDLPLSFAQQRLWFLDQMQTGAAYNIPLALRLQGPLHREALKASLNEVVRRHEALRTAFPARQGRPTQVIAPELRLPIREVDLSGMPEAESAARRLATEEGQRLFDLARGPVMRASLLRLAEDDHVLLFTIHHIVADGWSMGVLSREITALYRAFTRGEASPLAELQVQYADFSAWQREWLQGEVLERQLSYWRDRLDRLPPLQLPTDRPRPALATYRGARRYVVFPATLAERLARLCRAEGATLFMVLLAGLKALLHRSTGQLDLAVGSPIANRNHAATEDLIGFFVNSLTLRTDLSGDPTFREALGRVRETALGAYDHQDLPFEKLVEELQPERDLSQNPLFQLVFAVQNAPSRPLELPGLALNPFGLAEVSTRFDLEIHVWEGKTALAAVFCYNTDLFDASTVDRMGRHWLTLLEAAVAQPEMRLSDLPLLTAEERREVLSLGCGVRAEPARDSTVQAEFEAQAERAPSAVAVSFGQICVTYGELEKRANQLAHFLRKLGVGPEVRVGICCERSAELVVGVLGVLKAGGAYVAMDPAYPKAQLRFVLADAGVPVFLTQERLLDRVPEHGAQVLCLDRDWEVIARERGDRVQTALAPDNLAYVIFTSGSTGRPKGVEIPHRGLMNLVRWHRRVYEVTTADRATQLASPAFDASVWEIWPYLTAGASLHIPDEETRLSPGRLKSWLAEQGITLSFLPTPLAEMVLKEDGLEAMGLRVLLTGGDKLHAVSRGPLPFRLVNHYGPTECSVVATCAEVVAGEESDPPIGRPIDDNRVYVLDHDRNPVPVGVTGELYIGGVSLARGYLGSPELTAERFVPDPFAEWAGSRLYRTGDMVRYRAEGTLEFLGRIDHQVKIRGFRVELGEVEAALCRHPEVKEAVVVARAEGESSRRLVAYVVHDARPRASGESAAAAEWQGQHISHWRALYEETYGQESAAPDPSLNITGWNSSYTGEPIPAEEMREWAERTAERVLSLEPKRVLEIGCGTGLLLSRIASRCERYVATDFSGAALRYVRERILAEREWPWVDLLQRTPEDFEGIEAGAFDTVVLNSVIQYFPGVEYLLRVLEGAVRALRPGGSVFVGDVRNLRLLETYHASVQLHRASSSLTGVELRQRVRDRVTREEELALDPSFFVALKSRISEVRGIRVLPKRGAFQNELSKFRYDAILEVGAETARAEVPWVDWGRERPGAEAIRRLLARGPDALGLAQVPNRRVWRDVEVARTLASRDGDGSVSAVRESLGRGGIERGVDPEELWELPRELPYRAEISWLRSGEDGAYDVAFRRLGTGREAEAVRFPGEEARARPLTEYANDPLRARSVEHLVPRLRASLEEVVPDHMVPGAFVVLESLPLTPNGKVDRSALPAPGGLRPEMMGSYVAPRGPIEEMLAGIWGDVLGLERVGVHDDFFELGGHSLLATQLASRVRDAFRVELPLRNLFESPTVARLAERIDRAHRAGEGLQAPPLVVTGREGPLPLSFAQQRLWFLNQFDPTSPVYNISAAVRLSGPLDVAALERALTEIVRRHEALRTTFSFEDGHPAQVLGPGGLTLEQVDLSGLAEAEQDEEACRLAVEEGRRPFDLSRGPLFRARLLRLGEEERVLLLCMHHIVSDGWSLGILSRELAVLYEAFLSGKPSPLAELPIQYADFAQWQREWLQGEALESRLTYWRERLGGSLATLQLPTDRPRPKVQKSRGARQSLRLPPPLSRALRSFCRGEGVTTFMVLLAAFKALLNRYTGQKDIVVGTPIANRNRRETEGLIGFFVNTLVLRTNLSGRPSFREVARRVQETALGAYAHQDLPFDTLVEELNPARDLGRSPLFQVVLALQNAPVDALQLAGLTTRPQPTGEITTRFDLEFHWYESAESLTGILIYNRDLWDAATMERLLGHFHTLLHAALENPDRPIDDLELLGTDERRRLLEEGNGTRKEPASESSIVELFEAQVARNPGAEAAVFRGERLSYVELNRRSNQLARHLRGLGVGPEARVGICVDRSLDMIVGLLGILKAGGAYIPLDPSYPRDRLVFVLSDSGASVLLTQERLLAKLPPHGARVVCLDRDWQEIGKESGENPESGVRADNLAYVIHTSGSTGRPKGVQITHRGLINMAEAEVSVFGVHPGSRVLQFASLSFDASIFEIVMALRAGACLCLGTREALLPGVSLLQELRESGVSIATLPPSALAALPMDDLPALEVVTVAGESCPRELVERWASGRRFFNLYGPTEATVWSTYALCTDVDAVPPIGGPIRNTRVYVLDSRLQLVPPGVPGELHIGGVGLARGYLNRPDLTAERFVPDPFAEEPGGRLYRTGDLVRRRSDGTLEFVGRQDSQVKLRGFRIELGEIEATLREHDGVKEAVAAVREDHPGDQRLVAYVTARDGQTVDASGLRSHLKGKLPEYMVPSAFVALESLPLSPNGKVDRRALPAPDGEGPREATYAAPTSEMEKLVAGIWSDVLDTPTVGIHDNFFDLGGHSLLVVRVHRQLHEALPEVELPVVALFEHPTVASLAGRLSADANGQGAPRTARSAGETPEQSRERLQKGRQRLGRRREAARRIAPGEGDDA